MRTPKLDAARGAPSRQQPVLTVPERSMMAPRQSKTSGSVAASRPPPPPPAATTAAPFDVRGGADELDDTSSSDGHHAPLRRAGARHGASDSPDEPPMPPDEAGTDDGPRTVRKQPRQQLQTAAALSPTEKARRDRQERAFDVRKVRGSMGDAPPSPLAPAAHDDDDGTDSDDDDEEDEDGPVTWSTRLFKDVFIDWGVVAEVVLCHPCNISAQINAALAEDTEGPSVEAAAASPSGPGVVRAEELPSTRQAVRRRRNFSSSSSSDDAENNHKQGGADAEDARLRALREQLPPLDVVPCVGVIVLDFMCCGAGSMYFGYWIRNELAQRFHLVPDVGHLPTDDLAGSFSARSADSSPAAAGSKMDKVTVGRKVSRRKKAEDADADDNGSGSPGLFTKEGAKARANVAKDKAKDAAAKAAKKSEKLARKAAKKAARTSAEYLQSTVSSAVCWPCALCQTHRELEVRGFRPVRYLSSTRTAVQYAAGSLSGQPGMVASYMK